MNEVVRFVNLLKRAAEHLDKSTDDLSMYNDFGDVLHALVIVGGKYSEPADREVVQVAANVLNIEV